MKKLFLSIEADIVQLTNSLKIKVCFERPIFCCTALKTCQTNKEFIFGYIFHLNVHRECNEHPLKLIQLLR